MVRIHSIKLGVSEESNLREPLGNKVWFAGEATNTAEWHATSVGAWDTGGFVCLAASFELSLPIFDCHCNPHVLTEHI